MYGDLLIAAYSVEPGAALKSPATMRDSARPVSHASKSAACVSRALVELEKRGVDVKLTVRPFTSTVTLTAESFQFRRSTPEAIIGNRERIMFPRPFAAPAPVANL